MMSAQSQRRGQMTLLLNKNDPMPFATSSTRLVNMFTKPRPVRSLSPSSTDADYGDSDEDEVESMEEYAENLLEEKEVANWLLCSDPQPWTSPYIRAPMEVPFTMSSVPGPLFLQLFQFLMVFLGYVPRVKEYLMTIPHRMPARRPLSPLHYFDPDDRKKRERFIGYIPPCPAEDDMTYIVMHTPGTDEEIEKIRMTKDYSTENMETHKPCTLRVYRFPQQDAAEFIGNARSTGLGWLYVRKPRHAFDTVAVYRHGYRSWDIGDKDEWWALASSTNFLDTVRLREIAARTAKWRLSKKGHVLLAVLRFINWTFQRLGIAVQVRVPNLL